MLSCKEVTELCSAAMERPLRLGEQVSLRVHLMMCSGCTNYRRQVKTLRKVMQAYADGKEVSDESALHDPIENSPVPDRTRRSPFIAEVAECGSPENQCPALHASTASSESSGCRLT